MTRKDTLNRVSDLNSAAYSPFSDMLNTPADGLTFQEAFKVHQSILKILNAQMKLGRLMSELDFE